MRYQVPQFIDIKDRIIGPLTLKQFLYYVVAAMLLTPVYLLSDLGLFLSVAIPTIGVAAAFAHIRWHGQSFVMLLLNGFRYFTGERMYLWRREVGVGNIHIAGDEYEEFAGAIPITVSALDAVAQTLNTQGNVIAQDAADPMLEEEGEKVVH